MCSLTPAFCRKDREPLHPNHLNTEDEMSIKNKYIENLEQMRDWLIWRYWPDNNPNLDRVDHALEMIRRCGSQHQQQLDSIYKAIVNEKVI